MAISNQQIIDFLASNPTNQQIAEAMVTFKVSPEQITAALTEQEAKLGGTSTVVQNAETGQTTTNLNDLGGGFNATYKPPVIEQTEQGVTYTSPPELSGFSRVDPANKDYIQYYDTSGKLVGQEKILSSGQQVWSDLGPIVKAIAGQYAGQLLSDSGVLKDLFGTTADKVVSPDIVSSTPFSADYSLANGVGSQGLQAGTSANLATMGGGQGITLNLGAPSTTLADVLSTFGGVNPQNLTTMGGAQGLTYQTPTGLVTSTGTIPIGGLTGNNSVIGQTGINTATNIGSTIGTTIPTTVLPPPVVTPPVVPPTTPPVAPPVTPPVVTPPIIPPTITDILRVIAPIATIASVANAVTPKTTTPTGFDIVPIPEDWKTPNKPTVAPFTALSPINFGTQNLLKGTQFERFLDPNYGQVPEPVQYSQPSNLSYNDLMSILGSKQGMPSASSLSINDIISGIQNQYGQVPTRTMG
jgi:hypothetical protein